MGRPTTEGNKRSKKRWRIGGIRTKSKSKDSAAIENDHVTIQTTPESSHCSTDSSFESIENPVGVSILPRAMSDVDDDSDSDDDLYLDNDDDPNFIDKASTNLKGPQPSSGDIEKERSNSNRPSIQQETSNIDQHDSNGDRGDSDKSYQDDMKRHRMERRYSPHYSEELANISEDSEEHHCTCTTTPDNQRKVADPIVPTQPAVVEETHIDKNDEELDLPSHKELSKELCKIVATEHYTGEESLLALEKLSKWAHTQDSTLLKHFLTYGGVVKVVDFLNEQIENANNSKQASHRSGCLMEAIHKAADVICNVCFVGKHGINEDIAVVNATVVVKYGGIETLLLASDAFNKSEMKTEPRALKAAEAIWNAIMNVYCNAEAAVTKAISILVLDASIETMSAVGSIDHPIASETLANVFNSLYRITYHDFVTKEEFHQSDLLKHCLSVFKRDVTSSEGDEELLEEAISFLYGCHEKGILDKGADYECVLPLCVMGLREFAHDNDNIREWASKLLDGACSNIEKKESIVMAEGAIEALAPFLTFQDVDATEKEFLRNLIRKIVMVY
jgi:hypothetical protein